MKSFIRFSLNGSPVGLLEEDDKSLLWLLHTEQELTDINYGCDDRAGEKCIVLIEGEPMQASHTTLKQVAGKYVLTTQVAAH